MPNLTKIASLLRQSIKFSFQWTPTCQQAFDRLKDLLTSPPVLAYPDFSTGFVLYTDASGDGLGAVSEQEKDGQRHPVAYASRSVSKHEKNYTVTELEALAVVWAVRHLLDTTFTNHSPLKSMLTTRHPSGKLARWSQTLAEVDVTVHHRLGRRHANANALSRTPLQISYQGQATTI